ncbi:MAG: DNA breaking-rejoining protein [Gammaproteobacteria bacterium]|nr:MAG: DNA breaking-rejoining protein [Gammaproteobacteria bacterium]
MKITLFTVAFMGAILSIPAVAKDEVRNEQVHFERGTNGTTVAGSVKGYASINYTLGANSEQSMRVSLEASNASAYFNIYAPGKGPGDEAMFVGSMGGNSYVGTTPAKGSYIIQVYLMRNAARRNETANYKLHIGID